MKHAIISVFCVLIIAVVFAISGSSPSDDYRAPNPSESNIRIVSCTPVTESLTTTAEISHTVKFNKIKTTTIESSTASTDGNSSTCRIVCCVNSERKQAGQEPLRISQRLCAAAHIRAEEASLFWSHNRPNGTRFFTALGENAKAYRIVGENLAEADAFDAKAIVDAWMHSPRHRDNVISPKYHCCGVAEYSNNKKVYVAIIFAD